jgi:hypothetical protein
VDDGIHKVLVTAAMVGGFQKVLLKAFLSQCGQHVGEGRLAFLPIPRPIQRTAMTMSPLREV